MAIIDALTMFAELVLCGLILLFVVSVQRIVVYPRLTRGKGYPPPAAKMIIVACVFLGVFLFLLLFLIDILALHTENRVYRTLGYGILALGFICALPLAVTARLSQRETRKSGPRRTLFPYQSFGRQLNFLGLALASIGFGPFIIDWMSLIIRGGEPPIPLWAALLGLPIGLLSAPVVIWEKKILAASKLASLPDALEVLGSDKRPPILFLRGFRDETEAFIDVKIPVTVRDGVRNCRVKETFEEFFGESITSRLGPFLALGNPEDYLPPSDAATRLYLSDIEWFDKFQQFARDCACILIRVSTSDHIEQELRFVLSTELQPKLYILTPPKFLDLGHSYVVGVYQNSRSFYWPEFAAMLNRLGYNAPESCIPNGAVIGFDSEGKAEVVSTDAKSAADYISAIEPRLLSKEVKT